MNTVTTLNTDYLRSSRTLETILVSNQGQQQVFYLYNYEGLSFHLFCNPLNLINFFQGEAECDFHFSEEEELDAFLEKVEIVK